MELTLQPRHRWCVVQRRPRLTIESIKRDVEGMKNVQAGFTTIATPAPPHDQTFFKAYTDGRDLLVAIAYADSIHGSKGNDDLEIIFDLRHDGIGWWQFYFPAGGQPLTTHHQPYPEMHGTACPWPRLTRHQRSGPDGGPRDTTRWLLAWFPLGDIFRHGQVVGLNVARTQPNAQESTSWAHASGNGFQDASAMGNLHLGTPPARLSEAEATMDGRRIKLRGVLKGVRGRPAVTVVDPLGRRRELHATVKAGRLTASGEIAAEGEPVGGRYRVELGAGGAAIEPGYLAFDVASPGQGERFRPSITYDPPDNVIHNYYTPARIDAEMALWKRWGMKRVYWIEHGAPKAWPSFWHTEPFNTYGKHLTDILPLAARSARRHGMDLIAIYKPFDIAFNCMFINHSPGSRVRELEEKWCPAVPELAAHQEWVMRANPAWAQPTGGPVRRLRLHSRTAINRIKPGDVTVWTSRDNLRFTKYAGRVTLRQGRERRAEFQWTPAGHRPAEGGATAAEWYVELAGLEIDSPFAAVEIAGPRPPLAHRVFAFAEAWGDDDRPAPLTLADAGGLEKGFTFWRGWPGWSNYTAPALGMFTWCRGPVGMRFAAVDALPVILEPTFDGARAIWLGHLRRMLEAGVDGVHVRTLCHHNGIASYLHCAYAEPVLAAFRERFGRDPEPTHEDYRAIRAIRGQAYTQFLREGRALAKSYGKSFGAHLECGIEVGGELDSRMQMTLEWETWLREKIVDEVLLKFWCAHNPFIHERVLPLARRMGVEVHICGRNGGGLGPRMMELAPRLAAEACAAGFDGYSLYEAADLLQMNRQGVPVPLGMTAQAITAASTTVAQIG